MNKLGKMDTLLLIVIIAAGYLFISSGGLAKLTGGGTTVINNGGGTPTTPTTTLPSDFCAIEDTTITFQPVNTYDNTVEYNEGVIYWFDDKTNTAASVGIGGSGISGSPGQKLSYLYGGHSNSILTSIGNWSSSYASVLKSVTIPCQGTFTIDDTAVQFGNLTFTVYNEKGEYALNPGTTLTTGGITLGSGGTKDLKFEIEAPYQKGYPNGYVVEFVYPTNATAEFDLIGDHWKKTTLETTDCADNLSNVVSSDRVIGFEGDAIGSLEKHTGVLHTKGTTSIPTHGSRIRWYVYPKGHWRDKTGTMQVGYCNTDLNAPVELNASALKQSYWFNITG